MQDNAFWLTILGEVELTVSRGSYVTWFKNTRVLRHTEDSIVIGVPNIFAKQQLETRYKPLIAELLEKNGIGADTIEFKIHSVTAPARQSHEKSNTDQEVVILPETDDMPRSPSRNNRTSSLVSHSYRQGLNEKYTFDSFIVGSGNDLAYAATQAIAQNPGTKYNPLFVYGGVGLGKTHLIQAVGNAILQRDPKAHVVYISTEQFVQEFLDAIRYKKITDFAGHYRSADVLIVDDMQFIAGKEKTQEEFFHTFNALHQANKQIIISSDKPPKNIPTLEERLRSRFEWGMIVDIGAPDFETRCAILQNKAVLHHLNLDPDVIEFLANHIQSNIRELEGALNQLIAFCEMKALQPDINIVTSLFGVQARRPKHLSSKVIVERTAKYFQIPLEELLSARRDKDIVVPRQIAMYLLRSELHMSFPKIAHELGRKDHTTAIHSVEKIEKELHLDALLKTQLHEIRERLYA